MAALGLLLWTLALSVHGSAADPSLVTYDQWISVGKVFNLACHPSNTSTSAHLDWYHHRPGESPKLLFSGMGSRMPGTPARAAVNTYFSYAKHSTSQMLKISGVQAEDAGDYYCTDHGKRPNIILGNRGTLHVVGLPVIVPPPAPTVPPAPGSGANIILTQSPTVESVSVGGSVTLNCESNSSSITTQLAWYLQKPGESPKLLFSSVGSRVSGTPARFTDGGSGTKFMLKISGVQAEDAGDYYCQQHYERPFTQ